MINSNSKLRILMFQPSLAPYRVDLFNAMTVVNESSQGEVIQIGEISTSGFAKIINQCLSVVKMLNKKCIEVLPPLLIGIIFAQTMQNLIAVLGYIRNG